MVLNADVETFKSSASSVRQSRKSTESRSSLRSKKDVDSSRSAKSSAIEKEQRVRSKTAEGFASKTQRPPTKRPGSADNASDSNLMDIKKEKSEITLRKKTNQSEKEDVEEWRKKNNVIPFDNRKISNPSLELRKGVLEGQKKTLIYEKPSETYNRLYKEGCRRKNPKPELQNKRPSEIPKLKQLAKLNLKSSAKISPTSVGTTATTSTITTNIGTKSKSAFKPIAKEIESKQTEMKPQVVKSKKDIKNEDKIKTAMKENFAALVPLYEKEMKNITDTWVNTIYCSLTMRANLVKLLYKVIPSINRSQFNMEDETILQSITRTKSHTRCEAENLMQFIKLLIGNRNKARDDYAVMLANREIAEVYNNNWRVLTKKIIDVGEETKQLQLDISDVIKKRENYEAIANEKIHKMESSLTQKEEEIKKLANQLSLLKQRENSYKGNVSLKIEDYKDIKEEVHMLKSIEKEFDELKVKYNCQNDVYENKIKNLEKMLEEKKETLKKEKEVKQQLQQFLIQLRSHQQHLYKTIGKEQVDYVMGRSYQSKSQRREQLWMSAIKLVMKGFMAQTKKLERDRNKMLLELNSNDLENYNALATTIVQKDNFIKSIKQQMSALNTVSKYATTKTSECSVIAALKPTSASHYS